MENIIEINHLSKSFGEVKAVSDLTLRVKKGEPPRRTRTALRRMNGISGAPARR